MTRSRVAVVGVGNIGSTFAYELARAGNDVTVVARPGSVRLEQLRRDGGVLLQSGERAEMRVVDALDESIAYDLVIVTVLDHQVESVLPALVRSAAKCVQFMFVTLRPERLQDAVGSARCSFGMPYLMAMLDAEGKLKRSIGGQKTMHGDRRWVELFDAAGLPSTFEADMPLWLRCHVPLCVAFESISVFGEKRGGGASWPEALAVAREMRGGFAIVRSLGFQLYPATKSVINGLPILVLAVLFWLISRVRSFRELLATGKNECRALIDSLIAAAGSAPEMAAEVEALRAIRP